MPPKVFEELLRTTIFGVPGEGEEAPKDVGAAFKAHVPKAPKPKASGGGGGKKAEEPEEEDEDNKPTVQTTKDFESMQAKARTHQDSIGEGMDRGDAATSIAKLFEEREKEEKENDDDDDDRR